MISKGVPVFRTAVSFPIYIEAINQEIIFEISNPDIRPEFEAIRDYFVKALKKKLITKQNETLHLYPIIKWVHGLQPANRFIRKITEPGRQPPGKTRPVLQTRSRRIHEQHPGTPC